MEWEKRRQQHRRKHPPPTHTLSPEDVEQMHEKIKNLERSAGSKDEKLERSRSSKDQEAAEMSQLIVLICWFRLSFLRFGVVRHRWCGNVTFLKRSQGSRETESFGCCLDSVSPEPVGFELLGFSTFRMRTYPHLRHAGVGIGHEAKEGANRSVDIDLALRAPWEGSHRWLLRSSRRLAEVRFGSQNRSLGPFWPLASSPCCETAPPKRSVQTHLRTAGRVEPSSGLLPQQSLGRRFASCVRGRQERPPTATIIMTGLTALLVSCNSSSWWAYGIYDQRN